MNLQSPLGKARGLGAAKSGTNHWWMQRLTAIGLIPLSIWFIIEILLADKYFFVLLQIGAEVIRIMGLFSFICIA